MLPCTSCPTVIVKAAGASGYVGETNVARYSGAMTLIPCASRLLSGGPPWPGSLNHATPSCTTPKYSSKVPVCAGAWRLNVNLYVLPGGTVPVTPAGRLGDSQLESAKTLVRSRGWVVPIWVFESHVFDPTS